ncbi:MAG: pentapeptide repeat-containing protein [Alphaproteobacteria bacterium]|nr:pentapeptide repeat-containing protein [Alphaproteobacteria bacterium]
MDARCRPGKAILAGAQFNDADLRDADMARSDLTGASLADADLRFALLVRVRADGASFRGARWRPSIWSGRSCRGPILPAPG